jgi:hypothetical protein
LVILQHPVLRCEFDAFVVLYATKMTQKSNTKTLPFVLSAAGLAGFAVSAYGRLQLLPIADQRMVWGGLSKDPVVNALLTAPIVLPLSLLFAFGIALSTTVVVALMISGSRWVAAGILLTATVAFAPHWDPLLRAVGVVSVVVAVASIAAPFARTWSHPPWRHVVIGTVLSCVIGVVGNIALEKTYDRETSLEELLDEVALMAESLLADSHWTSGQYPQGVVDNGNVEHRLQTAPDYELPIWEFLVELPGVMFSYLGDTASCRAAFTVNIEGVDAVSYLTLQQ